MTVRRWNIAQLAAGNNSGAELACLGSPPLLLPSLPVFVEIHLFNKSGSFGDLIPSWIRQASAVSVAKPKWQEARNTQTRSKKWQKYASSNCHTSILPGPSPFVKSFLPSV